MLIFSASNRCLELIVTSFIRGLVEHYAFAHIGRERRHLHSFAITVDFLHMIFWMLMMICVLWRLVFSSIVSRI